MKEKSIKKNMVMSVLLTSSNFIFPLITSMYVFRVLGPEGTGRVDFVNSIIQYFLYIAILGIPGYGLREVAKVRDNKIEMSKLVQELLALNLISTLIAYVFLILAVIFVPKLYAEKTLFIVMGGLIFLNTIGLEWVYQAMEEYSYITVRSVIFKMISVILTFVLIRTKEDVVFYGFLHVFTSSASYILNFINLRKYITFQKKHKYNLRRHLKPILILFAASVVITIYTNFDTSMLGFISSDYEVGLYGAALKIRFIILSFSTAVTSVLVPRMSFYLRDDDKENAKKLIEKSFRVSLDLSIPIALFVFIFATDCIEFVSGSDFAGAVPTLRIFAICVVPLVITNLFGNQILIPSGNEKRYSQSVFVGMFINLGLNFVMIPKLGALGAAIATLITECWNVFWMSSGAKYYRKNLLHSINFLKYIVPMVMASAAAILAGLVKFPYPVLRLMFTAIIYFAVYYFALIFVKEPIIYNFLSGFANKIDNKFNKKAEKKD